MTTNQLEKQLSALTKKKIAAAAAVARTAGPTTAASKKIHSAAKKTLKNLNTDIKKVSGLVRAAKAFAAKAAKAATPSDRGRPAKAPGRRVSASGKVYYESRPNRADGNRRTRI